MVRGNGRAGFPSRLHAEYDAVSMTYLSAAQRVLKTVGRPVTTNELTSAAIRLGLIQPAGVTPEATMSAALYRFVRDHPDGPDFSRIFARPDPCKTRQRQMGVRRVTPSSNIRSYTRQDVTAQPANDVGRTGVGPECSTPRAISRLPIDLVGYPQPVSLVRSKQRVEDHGEVFTPESIVEAMLDLVSAEAERIDSRFLEPACGSGNFLVKVLRRKFAAVELKFGKSDFEKRHYALLGLMCTYGIELLPDNMAECRDNMLDVLSEYLHLADSDDVYRAATYVLSQNVVCGDALTMLTGDGRPITFAEWGYLGKGQFQRRDFRLDALTQSAAFAQEGHPLRRSRQARDLHADQDVCPYDGSRTRTPQQFTRSRRMSATRAEFVLRGRNPDVLTCIANLSNDEVFTPPEVTNRVLDTLAEKWSAHHDGASIWADPNVTFLDPVTKSGVFLREITSRLIDGLEDEIRHA